MKKIIAMLGCALALAACESAQSLSEGERLSWRCDGDKAFSLRSAAGAVEVYASGQTYRLAPAEGGEGEHRYSDGAVTYVESGGRATLTGVYLGPFENCRRQERLSRFF